LGKTKSSQTRTLCRGLSAPAAKDCQGRNPKRVKRGHTKNTWEKQASETPEGPHFSQRPHIPPRCTSTLPNHFREAIEEGDVRSQDQILLLRDPESQARGSWEEK